MSGDPRNPRYSLLRKYDIPIEHLSYEYVESCNERKTLERIVRILRSGEEGFYPDLLKTAEEKLKSIAPDSRVLRVEKPILTKESLTNEEWNAVESELFSWEEEMKIVEKTLDFEKDRIEVVGKTNMPNIREIAPQIPNKKVAKNNKSERIKSSDYNAWDKFDVDKELLKIEIEEERQQEENEKKKREIKKLEKQAKCEFPELDKDSYSSMEQQVLANQAKDRGNECYKMGDYANALKYYDISIKLYSTVNAYNNRAMTYLKLNEYENAIKDCTKVLGMENNIKALHRRATAYQNLANSNNVYDELAFQDLNVIVTLQPNNKVAQRDLQKLKKKLNIRDVGKKFRMPIYENIQDFYTTGLDNRIEEKKPLMNFRDYPKSDELPLTYYGPSTSTFQCEPYSMTHRELSGSFLPNYIMCKCNSNRTRQNPLCQRCGEAMCTPKPSCRKPSSNVKAEPTSKKNKEAINTLITRRTSHDIISSESVLDGNSEKKILDEVIDRVNDADSSGLSEKDETRNRIDIDSSVVNNLKSLKLDDNQTDESEGADKKGTFSSDASEPNLNTPEKGSLESSDNFNKTDLVEKENVSSSLIASIESQSKETNPKVCGGNIDKIQSCIKESDPETAKSVVTNIEYNNNKSNTIKSNESSQNVGKSCTKKSRSKKKQKESRRKKQSSTVEPIRVVHAEKYLHPTSVEPKIKSETPKNDQPKTSPTAPNQFKAFTPNRKCLSIQRDDMGVSGVSYSPARETFQPNSSKVKLASEGNKENILLDSSMHGNIEENNERCEVKYNSKVESAFEFIKNWEELRKVDSNFTKRAKIIRSMKPSDLGKVIGIKLDSYLLSSLLECLEKHFVETDPSVVVEFLRQLPQIPRFDIIKMFLDDSDKKVLKKLIETTESKGFTLDEELKKMFKVIG